MPSRYCRTPTRAPPSRCSSSLPPTPLPRTPAVRKSNIAAAEKSLWEEELGLHGGPDAKQAEASVFRQRKLDWDLRENPGGYVYAMAQMKFPFVATPEQGAAAPQLK